MQRQSKSPSQGSSKPAGSTSNFEQLVNTFGSPEVKAKLREDG
jgi:hypothetical protein